MERALFIEFLLGDDEDLFSFDIFVSRLSKLLFNMNFDFSTAHHQGPIFGLKFGRVFGAICGMTSNSLRRDNDLVKEFEKHDLIKKKFIKSVMEDNNEDLKIKIAWSFSLILFHSFSQPNMSFHHSLFNDMLMDGQALDEVKFRIVLESVDCLAFPANFTSYETSLIPTLNRLYSVFLSERSHCVRYAIDNIRLHSPGVILNGPDLWLKNPLLNE